MSPQKGQRQVSNRGKLHGRGKMTINQAPPPCDRPPGHGAGGRGPLESEMSLECSVRPSWGPFGPPSNVLGKHSINDVSAR